MNNQSNVWAYLRQMTISNPMQHIYELGRAEPIGIVTGIPMVEFSGTAPATPEVMSAMRRWMNRPSQLPYYSQEWLCLYCGSSNELDSRKCDNCSAPRNWLIG